MKDIIKQFLFLDTCTLVNLASNKYCDDGEITSKLKDLTSSESFILAIPEQVKKEWDRNKETKAINEKIQSFDSKIKNFTSFIKIFDQPDQDAINKILEKYSGTLAKKESTLRKNVTAIDKLLMHAKLICCSGINIQTLTIEHGMQKKAPFINKNSTADAIIFFSCIDYLKNIRKVDNSAIAYFVSENKSDFCSNGDVRQFHPDLLPYAQEVNLKYIENIGTLINDIYGREVINREIIDKITNGNKIICPGCYFEFYDKKYGSWGPSQYGPGISWHIRCPKCGLNHDTGDFWE